MSFNFKFDHSEDPASHKYLQFDESLPPKSLCNRISAHVINGFGNSNFPASALLKAKNFTLTVRDSPQGDPRQVTMNFSKFSDEMRKTRTIPFAKFNLPSPSSPFFDSPLDLARNFHYLMPSHDEAIKIQLNTPFGPEFPLTPTLDREGVAFTSFQTVLHKNIKDLLLRIVGEGERVVDISPVWINSLRMLLNDCVSLIEITLHQLYFGAQYKYKPTWVFNADKLGARHGRRVKDKIAWVGVICSRPLDDASLEIAALKQIREIRNHFSHLDPPCIAIAVEEIAEWCNLVPLIAGLAAKIRNKSGEQLNPELVEIILAPRIKFVPKNDYPRLPLGPDSGYKSSCWQSSNIE
ncbi:MAG: hypothetical protein V4689_17230 [Verrucomicrobiota bacterium]